VFRDESEANQAQLASGLRRILTTSRKLVVVCSPTARERKWVGEEIRAFAATHQPEDIIAVLADGMPDEEAVRAGQPSVAAFPPALLSALAEVPWSPDFRRVNREKRRIESSRRAWYHLLACIFGVSRDVIEQRERRRRIRRLIVVGIVALFILAIAFKTSDIIDWAHFMNASWAVDKALRDDADVTGRLGLLRSTQFYCTWFQSFHGGKIFYLSATKLGLPGPLVRGSVLLSTLSDRADEFRWYFARGPFPPLRSRVDFMELLRRDKSRADDQTAFPQRIDESVRSRIEKLFFEPGQPQQRPLFEGGIAHVYALYGLDRVFGEPYIDLCRTTVVVKVYDNGLVIGGAPAEHCFDVEGVYVLQNQSPTDSIRRGTWKDKNRYPPFGSTFKRACAIEE
jgi:hypothetical protein